MDKKIGIFEKIVDKQIESELKKWKDEVWQFLVKKIREINLCKHINQEEIMQFIVKNSLEYDKEIIGIYKQRKIENLLSELEKRSAFYEAALQYMDRNDPPN